MSLTRREVDAYYHGFANRTLWPLLHGLVEQPTFDRSWWDAYRFVNAALRGGRTIRRSPGFRWVHDYHLLLLPELLRAGGRAGRHRLLPARAVPAARGVRAAAVADDRARGHARRRRRLVPHGQRTATTSCARAGSSLDGVEIDGTSVRLPDGRVVRTAAHPISIDAGDLARAGAPARRRAGARRPAQAVRRPPPPARRRPARLHEGHPRAAARDRAAARAAARPAPRDHVRPGRRPEPGRDPRVPGAARRRSSSSSAGSTAASPSRASTCPSTTSTAASRPTACSPTTAPPSLPRDAAPGRDEPRRQGVRHRAGRRPTAPACSC